MIQNKTLNKLIQIGKAKIRTEIPQDVLHLINNSCLKRDINNQTWWVGTYHTYSIRQPQVFFRQMESHLSLCLNCPMHQVLSLQLFSNQVNNQKPSIIMEISQIHFTQLQVLYLRTQITKSEGNNITSIEQLQFINMPNLDVLSLSYFLCKSGQNKITTLSALNKCGWNLGNHLSIGNSFMNSEKNPYEVLDILRLKLGNLNFENQLFAGDLKRGQSWMGISVKMNFKKIIFYCNDQKIQPTIKLVEKIKNYKTYLEFRG